MGFSYLKNAPIDKTVLSYLEKIKNSGFEGNTEIIDTIGSNDRVTAEAVYAKISSPHYPACAMDGIAIKASDTFGAGETTPVTLDADKYIDVDTGDPLPDEMDAVIMIEEVIRDDEGRVRLHAPAAPWQHVRQIGEDICMGDMILPGFTRVTPAVIGSLLAGGVLRIPVIKKPVVGIIPTGDEIVAPTDSPKSGDIIEFNSSIFSAMIEEWGGYPKVYPIAKDKKDVLLSAMKTALSECDIVLMNAGSSAGRDDYTAFTMESVGEVFCHGIAVKPGKPAVLGCANNKPIIGIPGYPVSGIVIMEEFVKRIIDLWYHRQPKDEQVIKAKLSKSVVSGFKYKEIIRVRLGKVLNGWIASPLPRGAGVVSSFMKADGLLEIPQDVEGYEAGEEVTVKLMRPMSELTGAVNVIGSHDPLLDEIGDILHKNEGKAFLKSSHVGSMGGIMAIRRGECHIAGIHLLDEADGSYNYSYINKYFPNGGVRLIECIGRKQGIMLQHGNPKGIKSIEDLAKDGIRYVNRQKGAGTRILFDYLLKTAEIDSSKIYGYDREELTHTSVAAQIASDTADAGMGIYSAANMYGLDFVEICMEKYDLLIPDYAWDNPNIQSILKILESDEFKARLERLGGYEVRPLTISEF